MDKRLKIAVVCGFGVVSCAVLKRSIEDVLELRRRFNTTVITADLIQAVSLECDLIITPEVFSAGLQSQVNIPVLGVASVLNPVEFEREGILLLRYLEQERQIN